MREDRTKESIYDTIEVECSGCKEKIYYKQMNLEKFMGWCEDYINPKLIKQRDMESRMKYGEWKSFDFSK